MAHNAGNGLAREDIQRGHPPDMDPMQGDFQAPSQPEPVRPLNVKDALSYLDAVKMQFTDNVDIYNEFLEIMKEFKSQTIDTPGVIERVATLFRGHNDLIQGFNTFLPQGYRIDCSGEAATITVTTPEGTTTQSSVRRLGVASPGLIPQPFPGIANEASANSQPASPIVTAASPAPFGTSSAATTLGGMSNKEAPEGGRQGPPSQEFQRAIQYVNKIKVRFEQDPETYQRFLAILQSYTKEQNQSDVYSQVNTLFKGAPHLLEEFKTFLPADGAPLDFFGESSWAEPEIKRAAKSETAPAPQKRRKRPQDKEIQPAPVAAGLAPKAGGGRSKKSKHGHARETGRAPSPAHHSYSRPQTPSQHHQSHNHPSALAGSSSQPLVVNNSSMQPGSQDELAFFDRAKKALDSREVYDEFLKLLNLFSREIIDARSLITRATNFLGDGELYNQFKDLMGWDDKRDGDNDGPPGSLRNYNTSNNDVEERYGKSYRRLPLAETKLACSGRDELCRSVLNDVWVSHPTWASEESGFVSHKKNSYEEALHKSEEERHEFQFYIDIITRTIALLQPLQDRILEMSADERHAFRLPADFGGSSKSIYHRAVKKVYGRDSQGLEVLQALQDCPGIAVPVVLPRLKQKNEEWRRAQRDWNRVWREVDARNFYKSLDHQGITFKANDKKYITTKSFVQEIENAKSEHKDRLVSARTKIRAWRKANRTFASDSKDNEGEKAKLLKDIFILESSAHLEFSFNDLTVLQDALKLVFSFLERSALQYSSHERRTVERTLRTLVPLVCMFPTAEFDSVFGPPLEADAAENEEAARDDAIGHSDEGEEIHQGSASGNKSKSGTSSGRRSAGGGGHGHGGVHPNDLRKKLLKTAQEKAAKARSGSASVSRAVSPAGSDDDHAKPDDKPARSASPNPRKKKGSRAKEAPEIHHADCEEWIKLMSVSFDSGSSAERGSGMDVDLSDVENLAKNGVTNEKPFFTNTTLYTLLRLLQLLYSRLLLCKEIAARLIAHDLSKSGFAVNKVAEDLGLVDGHGPGAVLALAATVPLRPAITPANAAGGEHGASSSLPNGHPAPHTSQETASSKNDRPEAHFYGYMLEACEKLFEGELDQVTFEENMRFLFGTKAYNVFTLDKLIAALIKQVQTVIVDSKCQELVQLLSKVRSKQGALTVRELIAYRREAEQYLGPDDHLYRVHWDEPTHAIRIWLLGSGDTSVNLSLHAGNPNGKGSAEMNAGMMKTSAAWAQAARWRAYAESYVLAHPTELVVDDEQRVRAKVRRPFLARTREGSDDEHDGAGAGGDGDVVTSNIVGISEGGDSSTHAGSSSNNTNNNNHNNNATGTSGVGGEQGVAIPKGGRRWVEEGGLEVGVGAGTYRLLFRDGSWGCGYMVRGRGEVEVLERKRREGAVRRGEKLRGGLGGLVDC